MTPKEAVENGMQFPVDDKVDKQVLYKNRAEWVESVNAVVDRSSESKTIKDARKKLLILLFDRSNGLI